MSLAKSCTHCVERLIEVDSVDNVNNHLWNSVTCLLLLLLLSTQKFCHPEIHTKYATPVFFSQSCMIMVCMVFPATCVFIIIFSPFSGSFFVIKLGEGGTFPPYDNCVHSFFVDMLPVDGCC